MMPGRTDRILLVMPFYHIGAKCNQLAYSLRGATVILHRSYDIRAVAESIERDRATVAHLAPIMVQDLLDLPDLKKYDHSSLRLVLYASGPMAVAQLAARARDLRADLHAGLRHDRDRARHRAASARACARRHAGADAAAVSAGQAALGYEIRVVRADGTECDAGRAGRDPDQRPRRHARLLEQSPGQLRRARRRLDAYRRHRHCSTRTGSSTCSTARRT